jgi:hypothetical protein
VPVFKGLGYAIQNKSPAVQNLLDDVSRIIARKSDPV